MTDKFELPNNELVSYWTWIAKRSHSEWTAKDISALRGAIASIPNMVEEIGWFQRREKLALEVIIDKDNAITRLRALNAELLITAERYLKRLETLCSCAESSGCKDAARRAAVRDLIARAEASP